MAKRKLVVKGRGPDASVTFSIDVYRGQVWLNCFDCPCAAEAIFEPAQVDSFVNLMNQASREARSDRNGSAT